MTLSLTVVVLTRDEEANLARCLQSIRTIAAEIVVVDSGSTDATTDIARSHGAKVVTRAFVNQAEQFNWALDHLPITSDWVARLDADEVFPEALCAEIARRLPGLPDDVVAVALRRELVFMGQEIRFGGRRTLTLTRLWRRGHGRVEPRWMDEHVVVDGGRTITFASPFHDDNRKPLSSYVAKHNDYATREAIDRILSRHLGLDNGDHDIRRMSPALRLKRLAKRHGFNRLPFAIGPLLYFLLRYLLLLGFCDGRVGLIYHVLQGFWYRFLVDCKDFELMRVIGPERDPDRVFDLLERATGKNLDVSRRLLRCGKNTIAPNQSRQTPVADSTQGSP